MAVETRRLLERSGELAQVQSKLASARDGRGAALMFSGPAGIGKTTLLEATRGLALDAGFRVLSARAGELESELGWNVVRQLFEPVITASEPARRRMLVGAAALAGPALGLESGDATGALHGLYWLATELAEEAPTLLCVDDAQWADLASLRFLAYLVERVFDLSVLVAGSIRGGEELPDALSVLTSRPACEVLTVHELSEQASLDLAREALGREADTEFCAACHEATGGNPFLLHALLGQLRRDGVTPTAENVGAVTMVTPGTVVRVVREVIYRDLPSHGRSRLHGNAGRLLAERGETSRAASQLLLSEPQGDPWVVARLAEAAAAAQREGAPTAAAEMLERAVREPPPVGRGLRCWWRWREPRRDRQPGRRRSARASAGAHDRAAGPGPDPARAGASAVSGRPAGCSSRRLRGRSRCA